MDTINRPDHHALPTDDRFVTGRFAVLALVSIFVQVAVKTGDAMHSTYYDSSYLPYSASIVKTLSAFAALTMRIVFPTLSHFFENKVEIRLRYFLSFVHMRA